MPKPIRAAIAGVLVLAGVVVARAATFSSRQLAVPSAPAAPLDSAGAVDRLSRAIRIATVSTMEGSDTERTESFAAMHELLRESFPRTHSVLERETVSGGSLLYTWRGSDPALAPILLTGHLDVVPVEPGTEGDWEHPPFAGTVADGYVWGRGAMDDKAGVMGILEAVESLLSDGFRPRRTVHLAFGHDEEVGGRAGAVEIARRFAARGVRAEMVVDEGGFLAEGIFPVDRPVAAVAIGEKGYLSLRLRVDQAGGHSSMPGRETAVGVLAGAVLRLQERPFPAALNGSTAALFEYLGPELPFAQRAIFANRWLFGRLVVRQLSAEPSTDAMLRTTTAPTMLSGSVKDNVLPARAEAVVNFRIVPGETVQSVTRRVAEVIDDPRVRIEALPSASDPAPVSSPDTRAFATLHRTIREIYPEAIVAPWLLVATTDARHYTAISPNVYRFQPIRVAAEDTRRFHGTDERVGVGVYMNGIRFYRRLLQNASGRE